jgi:3-dehydroquinate synthase class II
VQSPQRQAAAVAAAQQAQPQLRTLQRGTDSVGVTLAALSEVSQRHAELTQELQRREVLLHAMGEVSSSSSIHCVYIVYIYHILCSV